MNNILKVCLILALALSSSLSYSSIKEVGQSCLSSINKIAAKVISKKAQKPFKVFKSSEALTEKHFIKLNDYAKEELKFNKKELALLKEASNKLKGKVSKEEFYSFVVYSKSLNEKKRLELLSSAMDLTLNRELATGPLKKFYKIGLSIDKKSLSEYQKILVELETTNPKLSKKEIYSLAVGQVKVFRRAYEKMSYGCRSNIWTTERVAAKNAFLKFKLGIGMASSIAAYSYQNQDKFKEDKTKWASKLGYELTFAVVSSYISTGIISNPASSIIVKSGAKYLNARAQGLVDWALYAQLFGGSEKEAILKIEEIKNDENKMKLIKELQTYLKNEYFYTKYKKQFLNTLKPILIHGQLDQKKNSSTSASQKVDWDNLIPSDLDSPIVMKALIEASLAKTYEESKGGVLEYGSVGADRFGFHAAYGALLLPRDIAFDLYIYHILCMGSLNPKAAFVKALGIYVLNRMIFDQLYYYSRKHTINQ